MLEAGLQAPSVTQRRFGGLERLYGVSGAARIRAAHVVVVGVGGVTALGCTFGQGLSGISTLSLNACVALAAIVLGAVLALRQQAARLERTSCA